MLSRSYMNLSDLASGKFPAVEEGGGSDGGQRRMSSVKTAPSTLSELDDDGRANGVSPVALDRIIIVANQLPVRATRLPDGHGWSFAWDDESLLLQLKDGFPDGREVIYVGSLHVDVEADEQDDVSESLLTLFKCVPTFLPPDLFDRFYHGVCKQILWPFFHSMIPIAADCGDRFDRTVWESYVVVNRVFSQRVIEVINPESDYVWIHDYHLMLLPTLLRRRFTCLRMGFFHHIPFPTSEIYCTIPVREEILRALLNCDLIGFHTFEYARHFLSCCSRMLGLHFKVTNGLIGIDYYGRTVCVKIMHVGVHIGHLERNLALPDFGCRVAALRRQFNGQTVLLGVDDTDIFKGVNQKLMAFERMLRLRPEWQGKAVLVQIVNPPRGRGRSIERTQAGIQETCRRINDEFGGLDYKPVVFIDRDMPVVERIAYYAIAECLVVTPVRDGMNLIPYEYIVCRNGIHSSDPNSNSAGPRESMLVVSEFIGCSPSLADAIRVNPWDIATMVYAMLDAILTPSVDKRKRHEKHYKYVRTNDVCHWSRSFLQDLETTCKDHFKKRCWGVGFGFGFRVTCVDHNFGKLDVVSIVSAYENAKSRAILLDYDGTLIPHKSKDKEPSDELISIINTLCSDKKNVVFIVSGRSRDNLSRWFSPCRKLGLAAEHGYFVRWNKDEEWETCGAFVNNSRWIQIAEPVLELYTEATDGSYIDTKESAIVWHYQDADPDLGFIQAKEIRDHLESVLANEPVTVKICKLIVEAKPLGVSKGMVAEMVLSSMAEKGRRADFVLCVGDDRSDEDMFEGMAGVTAGDLVAADTSIFACTVGQKPSRAKYFLDDPTGVVNMLRALSKA